MTTLSSRSHDRSETTEIAESDPAVVAPEATSPETQLPPVVADGAPAELVSAAPAHVEAAPRSRWWTAKVVMLLGLMCAIGALTVDMYLPSLPEVARDLGTTDSAVAFTITVTLLGGALGQFVIGPLSDRFGRRAPVLIGLVVHVVASLLCMAVMDVTPLIVLRFIQGIGNAAAAVTAIAVIRDRMSGAAASAVMSRLMLVIGVAPLLAPTIGSVLAGLWGWRSVFAALALFGVVLFVIVWRFLPETLPTAQRLTSTRAVAGSYRVLLRDRTFLAFALLPGLNMAALFAYVAASPFVIREGFGLTEGQFAGVFAIIAMGMVVGAQVNAALVRRFAPVRLLRLASPVVGLLGIALVVPATTGWGGLPALVVPLWLMFAFVSMVSPNASTLALQRHGERAGSAAALIGVSQSGIAGALAPIVHVIGGNAAGMAIVIVGASTLAFVVLALGTGVYRRGGWAAAQA